MAADSTKKMLESVEVPWSKDCRYTFVGEKLSRKDGQRKAVYRGHFAGTAPAPLNCDEEYCLKIIWVDHSVCYKHPQNREYFDLLDFYGEHQRKILARNPAAQELADSVRKNGTYQDAPVCVLVEPVYKTAHSFFAKAEEKPAAERLDVLVQYSEGSLELQDPQNRIAGKTVVAHRDMKIDNGLICEQGDQWKICLIDYASIRLSGEVADVGEPGKPVVKVVDASADGTTPFVLSSGNTAPEDVWAKDGYEVSEKTDVYALGMMLGNLFLKINGVYHNPNSVWAKENGWDTRELLREKMSDAFEKSQPLDENAAWQKGSWLEQALQKAGYRLQWDNLAESSAQAGIRQLFFDATRINPALRVGLKEFIARLKMIQKMLVNSRAKMPVSVYLFDRSDLQLYRNAYIAAAAHTYATECGEANLNGTAAPQILCLHYAKAMAGEQVNARTQMDSREFTVCDGKDALNRYIRMLPAVPEGTEKHPLNYAIVSACSRLADQKDTVQFSGKIHLFAPYVPAYEDMEKVYANGEAFDVDGLCKVLQLELGTIPEICIHAPKDNRRDSRDPMWYSFEPLSRIGHIPAEPRRPEPEPAYTPASGGASSPRQEPSAAKGWENRYLTGPGAAYILSRDGRKLYVGQMQGGD